MSAFQDPIIEFLKKETSLKEITLEIPPDSKMGDFAFPCFTLAKEFKKAPQEIAKELVEKFKVEGIEAKATGPYLNFFLNKQEVAATVLKQVLKEKGKYGSSGEGEGKEKLVEHTSINPNASPHVGRARNALLGDAIVRLLRFQGYKVEVHYLVNDIGKQIAFLVLAAEGKDKIEFHDLLDLYIDINAKAEKDDKIEKKAFELLNNLENGDDDVRQQFRRIVDVCIQGQKIIFDDLDIHYDMYDYESEYLFNNKTDDAIKKLEKTGKLFEDGHGRWVMDLAGYGLGMKVPVFVLTRADKTSLYGLRDIAYTLDKSKKGPSIVILGEDQKLYHEQMIAVMKELRSDFPTPVHYSFVLLKDGKMSTRKGNVVLLEDFMKEVAGKANEEIKKRYEKENLDAAKIIGYGALKYSILRVSPEKSVTFDLDTAMSFEGETGPYVQYAYARICSILAKQAFDGKYDASLLKEELEQKLITKLSQFSGEVQKASSDLRPHLIATYVYQLASLFNEFYHQHPVISEDAKLQQARLALVTCVKQVIETSLGLLGIGVLEKM